MNETRFDEADREGVRERERERREGFLSFVKDRTSSISNSGTKIRWAEGIKRGNEERRKETKTKRDASKLIPFPHRLELSKGLVVKIRGRC